MPNGSRPALLASTIGLVLVPFAARGGEAENWGRLRSMPRERRVALADKLKEFDALDAREKEAVRALDRKVAGLPEADQASYRSVLRRYHLWLQGLPEDQRNALKAAPPSERMAMVTRLRAGARPSSPRRDNPAFLQLADLNGPTPYELAQRLKLWFDLPPDQRAAVEKLAPADRLKRFEDLARSRGEKLNPTQHLTKAQEDELIKKLDSSPQLKNGLQLPHKKIDAKDPEKHARVRRRLAENYYFIEHPPEAVAPENLLRFETALPSWFRPSFDPLPPDEARRRLTILYRLVYPHPQEMPAEKAPPPVAAAPAAKPTPAAPKPAVGTSF
jgi:hypothetical protein